MLTTPRGICERDWALGNPNGTRCEFDAHFDALPTEKRKVRRIATACNHFANVASQEYDQKAETLVVLGLTTFRDYTNMLSSVRQRNGNAPDNRLPLCLLIPPTVSLSSRCSLLGLYSCHAALEITSPGSPLSTLLERIPTDNPKIQI